MKRFSLIALFLSAAALATAAPLTSNSTPGGKYLEFRSCDIYTGSCFANAEMGLTGKEGILVWSVENGSWNGASLNGLSVMAVVRAGQTLGDLEVQPRAGRAVLVVDAKATPAQHDALIHMARAKAGSLIHEIARVETVAMEVQIGGCKKSGCASVRAGDLVEIKTRCVADGDHLCGNEELYYPPLTSIENASPAVADVASFKGQGLNLTWELRGQRGVYLGTFVLDPVHLAAAR